MSRVRWGIFALALAFAADAAAGGELELISRTAAGLAPDTAGGRSFLPLYVRLAERSENARSVSADGRYVVFLSQAGNVVPGQPNPPPVALGGDLFVYDRVTRSRRLISRRLISSSLPAEVLSATISADDRFVAFESLAEDLVPGQLPGGSGNVYLYDREAASTTLVSRVSASGVTGGNGMSSEPVLSADGRFMAFSSLATDLISGQIEGNFAADVFLFDRASGTTVLVSRTAASATTTGNGSSRDPAISADGRYVAYESTASDLIAGQAGGGSNVFVFDSVAGTTTLVSHAAGSATDGAGGSQDAVISADGSRIAFTSSATDLVPGQIDTNFRPDAFLYDRTAGTTLLVSHASTSATTACDHSARRPALSSDGAYLVFESHATDLVAGQSDTNGFADVFLFETATGVTTLLSHASGSSTTTAPGRSEEPAISGDGTWIAFASTAENLVPAQVDTPSTADVFLKNRLTGETVLVTRLPGSTATAVGGFLEDAVISADGAYVAFDSVGEGLEAGVDDANQQSDVFLYDRAAGTNATVSLRDPGMPSVTANGYTTWASTDPAFSADGRFVAFDSTATNLLPMQTHSEANVFLVDRELDTVALVSRSTSFPVEGANRSSERPSLSEDGRFVAFESFANDLVGGQVDGTQTKDVFLFDRSAGSTTLVSHTAGAPGTTAGWYSQEAAVSGDGRYVAYWSQATTLVPGQVDTNNGYDLFLFDRISGATALVSHAAGSPATAGYPAKFFSSPPRPRISRDGRYVAYTSPADDLIGGMNSSGYDNLYLFDRVTGVNTLASRSAASPTVGGNDHTQQAALDSEGRFVAFASEATNLVAGQDDGNGSPDIFLYDRASGATVLVSRSANGVSRTGQGYSWEPEISADGRYVAYASRAPDLVPGGLDTNGQFDVFLFDRTTGVTGLASHKFDQPTVAGDGESRRPFINADGGYLSFSSTATDLAANGSPSAGYLYDRRAGAAKGIGGSGPISFDGRHVAFLSGAVDLVPGDYNSASDLFVFSDLPPAQDFYTLPPCRLFDSRESGAGGPLVSGVKALLRAHGLCSLPATAAALSVNVTVTQSTGPGHLTLFAGDAPEPGTSTINFGAGQTRANNAILSLATDGMGTLAVLPHVLGGGSVHVVLDVNGWFE